ncbi:ubiquitin-conjugating enzyme E2 Z [Rhipicephalus sanguineus]|uniref:Ubiquitin-conjugating enzyme E2 Z n=1 Tax=Rhipicephalus sanguineus TaxID=34632 RepID=A0A9D4T2X8_RHISA|nr:ubiquitin-conjugating enzyme E2 Z [Rhipicephalus sanguineus]KAH7969495.1 hypothetical protein HPB52_018965 [Rhipicephalus sanguineus]
MKLPEERESTFLTSLLNWYKDDEGPLVEEYPLPSDAAYYRSESGNASTMNLRLLPSPETEGPLIAQHPCSSSTASRSNENAGKFSPLAPDQWNPVNFEHEGTSLQCLSRCKHDIMDLITDPPPGVYIAPREDDITRIHALVVGPADTPYEGGFFHFLIQCPPEYPIKPPRVRLMNTDGGRVSFHPNLFESGQVCLNILGTSEWSGVPVEWSPAMSIASVLVSIQSLMAEKPYWSDEQEDCDRSCLMVQHETIRVAVCDAIEGCLKGTSLCPPHLREVMLQCFLDNIEKYDSVVESNINLTDTAIRYPFGYPAMKRKLYQYEELLTRLWTLEARVQDKLKSGASEER